MKDYNKESELKTELNERSARFKKTLYELLFVTFFGGLFIGYLLAHVVIYSSGFYLVMI